MSNPTHPVYTFCVNLETLQRLSWSLPNRTQTSGNETVAEADYLKFTRSTFLEGSNIVKKHGNQFTMYGLEAQVVKDRYISNPPSPDDVLYLCSP